MVLTLMFGDDLAFALQSVRVATGSVLEALRGVNWLLFIPLIVSVCASLTYLFVSLWNVVSGLVTYTVGFQTAFSSTYDSPWWRMVSYCANLKALNSILAVSYTVFSTIFILLASTWISINLYHVVPVFVEKIYNAIKRVTGA